MKKPTKSRNPIAKSLANRLYQPKVVKPKKGKGSYTRKGVRALSSGGKPNKTLTPKEVLRIGTTAASNRQAAIEAFKNPSTRLSSNLQMHIERFKVRNKAKNLKSGGKPKSTVNKAGNYTKPTMRKRLFEKIKAGTRGGKAGQWSARKAQLLATEYKKAGGGYKN